MLGWLELQYEDRLVLKMNFEHDNVIGSLVRSTVGHVLGDNSKFSVCGKERVEEPVIGTIKIGLGGIGRNLLKLTNDFGGPRHDDGRGGGSKASVDYGPRRVPPLRI